MSEFGEILRGRIVEIETHLMFIADLEASAVGRGTGARTAPVDSEPVNILKSGFLVHLYNVVEAVMEKVLEEVAVAARVHTPKEWCDGLLREWALGRVNLSRDLSVHDAETRFVGLVQEAIDRLATTQLRIRRRSGNWSNDEVVELAASLACPLTVADSVRRAACESVFEDGMPPMKYLRHKRNRLAHGNESFLSGAQHLPATRLADLRGPVVDYMLSVVESFDQYIVTKGFLHPKAP
ncbi:MAE_28990/MAE_18760 family HEPN-like nuclease [Cereibacter johrii]|uniref:MAE_28990/MAE_18760 family HEPN-like nuclease n=1 Tax=Cereibacter johrii TaxID=445629 RepID=UPI000DCD049B|nr:MAE_28990/MAE_18760 family HEPN-like nuclease [Cereibacter johrii]RAZ84457.1 hypothetical protein DDV93_11930 [Cereibacter johrii]